MQILVPEESRCATDRLGSHQTRLAGRTTLSAMDGSSAGGAIHPLSLRFIDAELEADYQKAAGREGLVGFRLTAGASALLWATAAFLLPLGTALPAAVATPVSLLMALVSLICVAASPWTTTLDRQHAAVALLTAGNGIVILSLASVAGVVPGYAVSAIMLLFAYAFVARTRFIFAALRTIFIAAAFFFVVFTYQGPGNLLIDAFIFVAAAVGTLLALRRQEAARRRVYHQQRLITAQSAQLQAEKETSDRLLANVLPASIVRRLRDGESTIADEYPSVSVLFADIVGFTSLAAKRSASEIIALLGELYSCFDDLVVERTLEKIKTVGDSYMAAGGLTGELDDHARRMVDLGLAIQREVGHRSANWGGLAMRVGIHTGPAGGGVIGRSKFAFDLWGDTVNVASRLEAEGVPGLVHVSAATWTLVKDHFRGESRGSIQLRGVGPMESYLVSARATPLTDSLPAVQASVPRAAS
jgi:adenylate cyclase